MGIAGKHVLKTFGPYKDIKVRYVAEKLGVSLRRNVTIADSIITPYPAGLPVLCTPARRLSRRCGKKATR